MNATARLTCTKWCDAICLAAVALFFAGRAGLPGEWWYPLCFGLAVYSALHSRFLVLWLRKDKFWVIGGACYTIYLYHAWVLAFGAKFLSPIYLKSAPFWINCCIQIPLLASAILLFCLPFYVLIERPCMDRNWPAKFRMRLQFIMIRRAPFIAPS